MKMLTTREAAERLSVHESRVRQLVLEGKLKATRFGARMLQISEAEVAKFKRPKMGRPKKTEQ